MNTYQIDSLVRLTSSFMDADGVTPVDPTTITLYVRAPDGVVTTYDGSVMTKENIGVYYLDIETTQVGPWIYKFQGSGNCDISSNDTYFQVAESAVLFNV